MTTLSQQRVPAASAEHQAVVLRPRFREGQLLRSSDLTSQQDYLIAMRRRHVLRAHRWGIVAGLRLQPRPDGFDVESGVAIDGFGRELCVEEPAVVDGGRFDDLETDLLDVWLVYRAVPLGPPVRGREDCGPGTHGRVREEARLCLTPATRAEQVDPFAPMGAPSARIGLPPEALDGSQDQGDWPVYLGRVRREEAGFAVVQASLAYAGLVGEQVLSPAPGSRSGWPRLQVGAERVGDARRFAVSLPAAAGGLADRLAIGGDGNTSIQGNAAVEAIEEDTGEEWDVRVTRATDGDAGGLGFTPMPDPPKVAWPYRVYRTRLKEPPPDGPTFDELRIEGGSPGGKGDPTAFRVAIGHATLDGPFQACLTVDAGCTVSIAGDLKIEGRLVEGPIEADPSDPRFGAAVASTWASGVVTPGTLIDDANAKVLAVTVDAPDPVTVGDQLVYGVDIKNTGTVRAEHVAVFETLLVDEGAGVGRRSLLTKELTIETGGSRRVNAPTFAVPAASTLRIEIVVLAVVPVNRVVAAKGSKKITVNPIIN